MASAVAAVGTTGPLLVPPGNKQISPYFNPTYTRTGWIGQPYVCLYIQVSPYFDPTYTRTGWIGQPPVLDRHEVVTIDGDVDTLRQATP